MKKVTIYGERCSGTNYLEQLLLLNFDVEITWEYGWKHWFGFNDLSFSDDCLFIGIVRNIVDWMNSLYKDKHHFPPSINSIDAFLNKTFYSRWKGNEIMEDRHILTKERYKNIFELRHVKNQFLVDTMPKLVKNYCLITYDDLTTNFTEIMNKIMRCGLQVKSNIQFPLNVLFYKNYKKVDYELVKKLKSKQKKKIPADLIIKKANLFYEMQLFNKDKIMKILSDSLESKSHSRAPPGLIHY